MIKTFSGDLYEQFRRELESQGDTGKVSPGQLATALTAVRKYLKLLREGVLATGFRDTAEEIWFFKEEKPRFYSWLIYYQECYAIEVGMPVGDGKERLAYYAEQLKYLGRFFRQHEFYYQYYKLGATELDPIWFVRGVSVPGRLVPEVPEVDPAFGTAQDYLFSKFMAYELVQAWLLEVMAEPADGARPLGWTSRKGVATRWTGDTCNLIEIIYGIYETRQVNAGEVDLSDLMDVFEQAFQVNLSRYFRRFTEIKRRKTISKTKYLDQMREAVNKKIEDADALPVKGKGGLKGTDKLDLLKDNPYL
jgi:hypothetical protein